VDQAEESDGILGEGMPIDGPTRYVVCRCSATKYMPLFHCQFGNAFWCLHPQIHPINQKILFTIARLKMDGIPLQKLFIISL
jgi:hypothetical protein